tara:strand:+ start:93 stop:341 length:249 start_codon:yes stop_codon:yes gene_type:complete
MRIILTNQKDSNMINYDKFSILDTAYLLMASQVTPKEALKVFNKLLEHNTCEYLYNLERQWYNGLNKAHGDYIKKIRKLAEK